MGDFKKCTVNFPFCLGMTDFCCCDSDDCVAEKNINVQRKQLSSGKPGKPPCHHQSDLRKPSARKVQKTSKGRIPANATRST